MHFYIVRPEVAGGIGDNTVMDYSGDRVGVSHLHYEFESWLGDELITGHPAFAATTVLADKFKQAGLTGFHTRDMDVTRTEDFEEFYPGREIPPFTELVIDGKVGLDDFAINNDSDLVLSQKALDILNTTNPVDTEILPIDEHGRPTGSG
ncbi:hypothetical protein [Pseudarthrobacter sp. TAF60_1]|uniref:hypothetical protein n=1 Tax=Pseudarthrobacter sp. TAF60_1 TaxID=3233071 RepID=UPI003F98E0D3